MAPGRGNVKRWRVKVDAQMAIGSEDVQMAISSDLCDTDPVWFLQCNS